MSLLLKSPFFFLTQINACLEIQIQYQKQNIFYCFLVFKIFNNIIHLPSTLR